MQWNAARRALKTFHQVILKFKENPVLLQEVEYIKCTDGTCWVPIQSFLDVYNNHIDKLAAEPKFEASKFKLVKSRALVDHEEGVSKHKPAQGGQWDAFVSFHGSGHCDVQVNYQLGIRNLFDNVEAWIKAWSSVWMVSLTDDYRNLDGDIGEQRNTPLFEVYATQIYAAMWRLAKAKVSEIFTENLPGTELVKALCAYLLVCGSVDLPQLSGVATVKNVFPQLPKTSPASVAGAIELLYPEIAKGFDDLANPKHVYTREFIALSGPTCMRNMSALLEKGGLPNCSPIPKNKERKFLMPGESSYSEPGQEHSIIGSGDGQSQQDLENLWAGTFGRNVLTAGNRAGYVVDAPFFCGWANRVKTSKAAVVFKKDSVEDVYMLFESRFSHCVLNMGFNPTVKDFMFSRSYLALVELLCGQATKDKIADAVEVDYPDDLNVQQKFPNKHPH